MPSNTEITVRQLARLVGTPAAPVILDVRTDEEFAADPRKLPASLLVDPATASRRAAKIGTRTIVLCERGTGASQGIAAWLRQAGTQAETLEGGFEAWRSAGSVLVNSLVLPPRDAEGRTVWVTRARPKVDRIACPWLIRRFVDPVAVFLFVAPAEVAAVAEQFGAAPFDVDGVFWSHRGDRCSFDTMIQEFGLSSPPLDRLAEIVRAADTDRLDLMPQAAGFLAASLGLSRMFRDDLEQLEAGMTLYDAFFRWCRDAVDETHDWPSCQKSA